MLFNLTEIFYSLSFFGLLFLFVVVILRNKYLVVTSLVFWMGFFYLSYIAFPCFCIEEINERWFFSDTTLLYCRIIIIGYNIFFSFYLYFCSNGDKKILNGLKIKQRCSFIYNLCIFLELLSTFVILIAVLKLLNVVRGTSGYRKYFIVRESAETMEAVFHLRFFLYLLLSICFYLFYKKRKIFYFFPLVLIVIFETLAGKRTTAFIVVLYLYILYVVFKKKLALKLIVPIMVILLVGILFSRADALGKKIDVNIIFGEFFETFTTLPYMIDNDLVGTGFKIERVLADYTFASFIPGSLKMKILSYSSVGSEIASIIGRGYGLGSNFIFQQLYEFGLIGIFTVLFIPLLLIYFDKKLRGAENLLIKILFVFQLRLYVREGITQFTVIFYLFFIYFSLFYFMKTNKYTKYVHRHMTNLKLILGYKK